MFSLIRMLHKLCNRGDTPWHPINLYNFYVSVKNKFN